MNQSRNFLLAAFACFACTTGFTWAQSETTSTAPGNGFDPGVSRTIVREAIVNAPRDEVWKAWTTAKGITTFFGTTAHIELKHRGAFEIFFATDQPEGQQGSEGCEVLSWIEGEMLCFTWNAPMKFRDVRMQRSFVVVQFADVEDEPARTSVTLTHGGFGEGDQWDEVFAYFEGVWTYVVASMTDRFNGGDVREGSSHQPRPMQHFTYFLRPSDEAFLTRTEFSEHELEALQGHVEHIKNLAATNKLIAAGPCMDPTLYPDSDDTMIPLKIPAVGIVIFKAHSLEDAKEIMEKDPAVIAGVFKAQVNSMQLAFLRP